MWLFPISFMSTATSAKIYSAEQIRIPPDLPEILKNYCKFIIKSKPENIEKSSLEYFQKLATLHKNKSKRNLLETQLALFYSKFDVEALEVKRLDIQTACELADVGTNQFNDTLAY